MAEFGEKLRQAREAKGMTQQTLAEKIFVTRQAVSRWECGDRLPDLITAKKLSQILEVSIDELLEENELKVMTEKVPIIDKPIINRLTVAIYALIVFSFALTIIDIVIRLPLASEHISNGEFEVFIINIAGLVIQTGIFIYGLYAALKGILSPKKAGIIAMMFFFSLCLADCIPVYSAMISGIKLTRWIFILNVLIHIMGGIAAQFYFCKAKHTKLCGALIIVVSLFDIARIIANFSAMINSLLRTGSDYHMNSTVRLVLMFGIYMLMIYQVLELRKKRRKVTLQK